MKNRKLWLMVKGLMLLLVIVIMFAVPAASTTRTWIRFAIFTVFTLSFIADLIKYRKNNA